MNGKIVSLLLIVAVLIVSAPPVFSAQTQTNDWNSLSSRLNREIAVKTSNKKTVFGILAALTENEITIQNDSNGKISFRREEVEKIWTAKLKGGRNTGKGALIGSGAGAAAGLIYVAANRDSADGQLGLAVPALAVYGAGIGAVIGFFARSRNQKKQLIYQK